MATRNFGGVIEGSGSAIPTNYQVTLNGNAGTRSVPPGTYGNFTVNGSSVLIFGIANATEPAVYNLQGLTLNGGTQLQIVGPVTLTLRNGTNINGTIGNAANPQWLTLNVSNGGVTLNGGSQMFGKVNAPAGSVTVNSRLTGNVICDRLTVNGGGVVTILAQAPQDTTAPVITLAEPAEGLITKTSPVTVSGTVTDTSAVTVTVNGQLVTLSGAQFSTTVTLAEGSNTITVLATDAFGNVGTASRNVTLDTTAPVLTITSPQDGAVTTETQLTITGTVTDATTATVTVNNVAATRNGNEFSAVVSLVEGPNTFVIRAEDAAGNQTEMTRTVTLQVQQDTTPPVITFTEPAEGLITNVSPVTVSGTVTDSSAVTVTVNSQPANLSGTQLSASVTLTEGSNTITISATDAFGNTSSISRTVVFDTIAPVLTSTSPEDEATTTEAQITVTGTVTDATTTTVTVNDIAATLNGTEFSAVVPLGEGINSLTFTATDAAGNSVVVLQTVIRNSPQPVINIEEPIQNALVQSSSILVTGTFTASLPALAEVNGIPAIIDGNAFQATVPVEEGINLLIATVTDANDNAGSFTRTIIVEFPVPLSLTVREPEADSVTNQPSITVNGEYTGKSVNLTVNDTSLPNAPSSFSSQVSLTEGNNVITVRATTPTENMEVVRNVILDTVPPVLANINPPEGTTLTGNSVTIQGSVTDATQVIVKVNGVEGSVANGQFTVTIPLIEGQNHLHFLAEDAAGNTTTKQISYFGQDRTPPPSPIVFPVVSPTRLPYQTILGRAEPGSQITITGVSPTVTSMASENVGLFWATVHLHQGENLLRVTSADALGNISEATLLSIISNPNLPVPAPGDPLQLNVGTGDAQRGLVNHELPRPLVVFVTDLAGAPVAGVPVQFRLLQGDGRFAESNASTLTVVSNSQGYAVARYVSASSPGIHLINATFPGNTTASTNFMIQTFAGQQVEETQFIGVVVDQNLRALPNVLIRLAGQQTRTGNDGRFKLQNIPSGPHQLLEVIGRDQIPFPGRWPNISYDVDILPGIINRLGRPFFLPRVNPGVEIPMDGDVVTQDTVVEEIVAGDKPPIQVTVKAGTRILFAPDVTDKRLSVTRIASNRIPMGLENGRATNLYISVQPSGAVFDPPLEVTFPNLDQLEPNASVLLMSFDHDAGRYVQVGTGTVSVDGKTISNDPGSGIRVGAWHGFPPVAPLPDYWLTGDDPNGCGPIPGRPGSKFIPSAGLPECLDCDVTSGPNQPVCINGVCTVRHSTGGATRFDAICQEQPAVAINSIDQRFAPSVETLNLTYSITPATATVTAARLEVLKQGESEPIYKDENIPRNPGANQYSWDGKANQGESSGKFVEPKDGPFLVRISVTGQNQNTPSQAEGTTNVEIASLTLDVIPTDNVNSGKKRIYKINRSDVETPVQVEATVKIKSKTGQEVTTEIPLKVDWSFDDPHDAAGKFNPLRDANERFDNAPISSGGKNSSIGGGEPKTMWKGVEGYSFEISSDNQSATSEVFTSGENQGKTRVTFLASAIGGDNYKFIAQYKKGESIQSEKQSEIWTIWKRLEFGSRYEMKGGVSVGPITTENVKNAFEDKRGTTEVTVVGQVQILEGNLAPDFVAPLLSPNQNELPGEQDLREAESNDPAIKQAARKRITDKAQAWHDRNMGNVTIESKNFLTRIGANGPAVIGAKYPHEKIDGRSETGNTNYYPGWVKIKNSLKQLIDPDGEWRRSPVQGFEVPGTETAFIFRHIQDTGSGGFQILDRTIIVGKHEIGHASDHFPFGFGIYTAPADRDHAREFLMHPNAGIRIPTHPNGFGNFDDESARRLRGWRPATQ